MGSKTSDDEPEDFDFAPTPPPASADPGLLATPECASGALVAVALGLATAVAAWMALRWRRARNKRKAT